MEEESIIRENLPASLRERFDQLMVNTKKPSRLEISTKIMQALLSNNELNLFVKLDTQSITYLTSKSIQIADELIRQDKL